MQFLFSRATKRLVDSTCLPRFLLFTRHTPPTCLLAHRLFSSTTPALTAVVAPSPSREQASTQEAKATERKQTAVLPRFPQTPNAPPTMSRVNVVQYNILAQTLTEGIEVEDPVCVEEAPRFEKIKDKLLQQMNLEEGGGAILCLQEVSYSAAGPFHCFFNQHDYYVAWCPYGSPFNNYMGVMIAFPSARYSLLSMDFKCLADQISSAVNNQDESSSNNSNGGNDDGSGNRRMSMLEGSTWILAANRRNAMLSVKLGIKGTDRSFLVATYHMPCAFRTPLVMNIHASLLLNHLSTLTNRFVDPLILCIDGNFVPFSDCHNAFVHGVTNQFDSLGNKELVSLVLKDYNLVDPKDRSLFSVYWKANGKEPLFTNRSKNPEDFTGTLDYIFVNWGKWNVERVLPLPEVATKFYPSIEEPSDHLLLMAELTLI